MCNFFQMSWGYRSAFLEIIGKPPILWNDSGFLVFSPFETMEQKTDRRGDDRSAFTLIELLIAVTIIAIIGIASIS